MKEPNNQALRADPNLWCLHTIGPDDVNAAPDFETAVQWAAYHNRMTEEYTVARGMQNDPHWPFTRSVVALWPWSPEAHAEDLPKSITACTPPIATLTTDRHAEGRFAGLEEAAEICEQQAREFLSEQYATPQPIGSIMERFACTECATAIRAIAKAGQS